MALAFGRILGWLQRRRFRSNQANGLEFSTPQAPVQEEAEVIDKKEYAAAPGQLFEGDPEPMAALSREPEAMLSREPEAVSSREPELLQT